MSDSPFDFLIVGAGSAGCVLANRLSQDPAVRVLLLEAGPTDENIFVGMPKGFAKLVVNPRLCWYYPVETEDPGAKPEVWVRGKMLGGSSSLNGMLYVRGLPSDFDDWVDRGAAGWGWSEMLPCFRAIEKHALGPAPFRGDKGPLSVSIPADRSQPAVRAFVEAAEQMGIPRKEDFNSPGDESVGYFPQTIRAGRRVSAAAAFLAPALRRSNLQVLTGTQVERIEFSGNRAVGVAGKTSNGARKTWRAGEIILCAGALNTPKLLQLSGIGPPNVLRAAGIDVLHANPAVGANMREHRYLRFQYELKKQLSQNSQLKGWRLLVNVARYFVSHSGILASGAFDAGVALKTLGDLDRPDVQINMVPVSMDPQVSGFALESRPGIQLIAYPMRPESRGSVSIRSSDPSAPLRIVPGYLNDRRDRDTSVRMVAAVRKLMDQRAMREIVLRETMPGPSIQNADDIVGLLIRGGGRGQASGPGQHAACTCAIGGDADAVVDPALRVVGVHGLRIMDASVMPTMVSGNTNAPVMAMAWRAADIILKLPPRL